MARPVGVYGDIGLFVYHFGGHYGLVSRARSGLRLLDDEANCAYIVTRLPKEPRCDDQFSLITDVRECDVAEHRGFDHTRHFSR